ncbi:hypothetical protein BKA63DRAFT_517994 [Paraphoma chrysanthemicola]|nr:hypothetical protein BKA63DRAFT_517994 [Paraphoma chrysanthemicola]
MRRRVVRDAAQALSVRRTIKKPHKRLPGLKFSEAHPFKVSLGKGISPRKMPNSLSKFDPYSKPSAKQAYRITKSRREFQKEALRRRGVFSWTSWDAKPWHTASLPLYRRDALSMFTSHAMQKLAQHEKQLDMHSSNRLLDNFWILHYRAMLRARRCEEQLTLHLTDTSITVFLLRTAPEMITRRILNSLRALELNSFELDQTVSSWAHVRKVLGHQHNRLYLAAVAFRIQLVEAVAAKRMGSRINAKMYRMELKSSLGSQPFGKLRNYQSEKTRILFFPRPENEMERSEAFFAALPLRWTIEPLVSHMRVSFSGLDRFSTHVGYLMARMSERSFRRLCPHIWRVRQQMLISDYAIKRTTKVLLYLTDEFAALRYYRYQMFPDSSSQKEIALGKSLWQLLRSRPSFGERTTHLNINNSTPVAPFKSPQAGSQMAPKRTFLYSPASSTSIGSGVDSEDSGPTTRETSRRGRSLSTGNTPQFTSKIDESIMRPRTSDRENENQSSRILLPRNALPSNADVQATSAQMRKEWRIGPTFLHYDNLTRKFGKLSRHPKAGGESPKKSVKIRKMGLKLGQGKHLESVDTLPRMATKSNRAGSTFTPEG